MITKRDLEKYDSGLVTDRYIYDKCNDDLEMYNFFANHCVMDEDDIKEAMYNVSDGPDAYYNALSMIEEDEEDEEDEDVE